MIFHTIEHRKPGDARLEAIYQQEDQRIAAGSVLLCARRAPRVPLHPLGGPDSQVDLHPECALHVRVCLMREVNQVEDRYGPMTAPPGSGHDQGRRART
jgi:hypothetical protein